MTKPLHNIVDIHHYRSILCLNGELPDAEFFKGNLPIIAADGAANQLIAAGIDPHMIVGDLDSVHHTIKARYKTLQDADQNTSDYQKSLVYLRSHDLLPTIVTGIHGGYLDHVLNNVNIFMQSDSILYAPPMIGLAIKAGESRSFELQTHTKISLIAFPHATISTSGLKWELQHHALAFPGDNSCFNRTQSENINIIVHNGTVLVLIYLETIDDAGINE